MLLVGCGRVSSAVTQPSLSRPRAASMRWTSRLTVRPGLCGCGGALGSELLGGRLAGVKEGWQGRPVYHSFSVGASMVPCLEHASSLVELS